MTGFKFQGRKGAVVIEGVVVAEEFAEAVRGVVQGLEELRIEDVSKGRSSVALRVWRKFLVGLRIRERVGTYGGVGSGSDGEGGLEVEGDGEAINAGGFFPEEGADEETAMPTAGKFSLYELDISAKKKGGKSLQKTRVRDHESEEEAESTDDEDGDGGGGGFEPPERRSTYKLRHIVEEDSENEDVDDNASRSEVGGESTGGFVLDVGENDGEGGGGFLVDDSVDEDKDAGGFAAQNTGYDSGLLPDVTMDEAGGAGGFLLEDEAETERRERKEDPHQTTENEPEVPSMSETDRPGGPLTNDAFNHSLTPSKLESPVPHAIEGINNKTRDHDLSTTQKNPLHLDIGESKIRDEADLFSKPDLPAARDRTVQAKTASGSNKISEDLHDEASDFLEEQSDHGSMISHDPDDEDAEPDWLEYESD